MKQLISHDEEERLKALNRYDILDVIDERKYDDFTLLASEICDVPISGISLVGEDRQWYIARMGLDIREIPREISFCSHAIMPGAPSPFVITDTLEDERFADNPLVVGDPNLRFYAGAQLITPDNFMIGTLCVLDRQPRQLRESQLDALNALARQVMIDLELRRTTDLLRTANEELRTLSLTDELTGLHNRRGFFLHAERQLQLFYTRKIPLDLWLLMGDMDSLKHINDTYGHHEGSLAIAKIGEIIKKSFRDTDIIGRLGGDEFGGMIINANPDAGQLMSDRLKRNLQKYNDHSDKPFDLSASFGLVLIDSLERLPLDKLLEKADLLMYRQKLGKRFSRSR